MGESRVISECGRYRSIAVLEEGAMSQQQVLQLIAAIHDEDDEWLFSGAAVQGAAMYIFSQRRYMARG